MGLETKQKPRLPVSVRTMVMPISRILGIFPMTGAKEPAPIIVRSRAWEAYSRVVISMLFATSVIISTFRFISTHRFIKSKNYFRVSIQLTEGIRCNYMWMSALCCFYNRDLIRQGLLRALTYEKKYQIVSAKEMKKCGLSTFVWVLIAEYGVMFAVAGFTSVVNLVSIGDELEDLASIMALFFGMNGMVLILSGADILFQSQAVVLGLHLSDLRDMVRALPAEKSVDNIPRMIRDLRQRHLYLRGTFVILNRAFGCQFLLSLTQAFESTTITIYYGLASKFDLWTYIAACLAAAYILRAAMITTACEYVTNQAQAILCATHDLLSRPDLTSSVRKEVHQLSEQVYLLPIHFSAMGVFYVDHRQLQAVIASITTYLVILMQMQIKEEV